MIFRKVGEVIIPPILYIFMRLLWLSLKKDFHFISEIGDNQHICVCWHSELLISPQAYRKIHPKHQSYAIVSSHFDGSLIAKTLNLLKIKPLRGSSRAGASQVLLQAFRQVKKKKEVLITPDGPKGPRYSMSDGAVAMAIKSGLPIFTMNYKADNYWQLKSWDKFVIPKPFSKIDLYLQSINVEDMSVKEANKYLKSKMLENSIL